MSISPSRNASCAGAISVSQRSLVDLLLQHVAIERMMQRQRAARQQPDHERGGQACERRRRERRHQGRALRHVAFERQREPAGDQVEMGSRHRAKAIGRHVERDHRRLAAVLR